MIYVLCNAGLQFMLICLRSIPAFANNFRTDLTNTDIAPLTEETPVTKCLQDQVVNF